MKIETARLILREINPATDFEGWAQMMSDERTVRYLDGKILNRALAWRNMAMVMGHWAIRGYGFFSLEDKVTGEWVGRVGPWFPEGWPQPEIGWAIAPQHWGKGYATEAGLASVDYAFNTLGWSEVVHVILSGNESSIAVAKKIGSAFTQTQLGLPGVTEKEVVIYGQSAD